MNSARLLQRRLPISALAVAFSMSACDSYGPVVRNEPGVTYGEIRVSTPRISGRERLINDRLEQERWISGQLDRVNESMLGFDGLIELKSLAYSGLQLRVQADPSFQVYKLQQEQAASRVRDASRAEQELQQFRLAAIQDIKARYNKKELTYTQAVDELDKLGVRFESISVPASAASAVAPGSPSVPSASLPPTPAGQGLLGAVAAVSAAGSAPTGSAASQAGLRGSPIDNFRDLMAVMEEMRSARLSNALDDAHDLDGNTLYRLTFDVTVLPEHDTSAWAVVEVAVDPTAEDADLGRIIESLRVGYERSVAESVDRRLQRMKDVFVSSCREERPGQDALLCSASVFPEDARAELRTALALIPANELPGNRDLSFFSQALNAATSERLRSLISSRGSLGSAATPSSPPPSASAPAAPPASASAPAPAPSRTPLSAPAASVAASDTVSFEDAVRAVLFQIELRRFGDNPLSCFLELQRADPGFFVGFARPPLVPEVRLRNPSQFNGSLFKRHQCVPFNDDATRLESFRKFLQDRTRASVYAVTPVETVQRLSEVTAARATRELLLGLSAATGVGSVSAGLQQLRSNEALAQAIRRQPVVVGFGGGPGTNGKAVKFGWVLGPQFNVSPDGKSTNFRHAVKQHAVSALISLPAWMTDAKLTVKTTWLPERGRQVVGVPQDTETKQEARLPARVRSAIDSFGYGARAVEPDEFQYIEVVEDRPASVLITGRGLWRSTDVYIGSQPADSVTVLPDMLGVRADFKKIHAPNGSRLNIAGRTAGTVNLTVFTSEGSKAAGTVRVKQLEPGPQPGVVIESGPGRIVVGKEIVLVLSKPLGGFNDIQVLLRSPKDLGFNVPVPDALISRDLKTIRFTVPPALVSKFRTGDRLDVVLSVLRAAGEQPIRTVAMSSATLFSSVSEASVLASVKAGAKKLPLELTLNFSDSLIAAYRGLGDGRVQVSFGVALGDDPSIPLISSTCVIVKNSCKVSATASATLLKSINDSSVEKKVRVELVGNDLPEILPGTLSL